MNENERNRVSSTRYMIPRAIHTPNPSLQSKPPLKVRVVIESMRANIHRIPRYYTLVDRSIKGSLKPTYRVLVMYLVKKYQDLMALYADGDICWLNDIDRTVHAQHG